MKKIQYEEMPALFQEVSILFQEKKDELCQMDSLLGDGDLGLTMSKGYGALPGFISDELPNAGDDLGKVLMKAGMKMSSLVPSTMGFLMSSGIMEGGKALKGKKELDGAALSAYLSGFANGVQKRGKCQVGQRTIYDSICLAAEAAVKVVAENSEASLEEVILAALAAAEMGMEATKTMVPIFGKAAVHAAKAEGIADQGAVAGYYKILGLKNYICK